MLPPVLLLVAMVSAACAKTATPLHVDHVILGVGDLDAGIRELEIRTGIHAVRGGQHPGRGTQNALASLGSRTYLEILAPQPGAKLEGELAELAKLKTLTPAGFAVFAPDVEAVRSKLQRDGVKTTEPQAGSRVTPSGTTLHWQTFSILEPRLADAPFFIHWDDLTVHPAKTSPGGCTFVALDLASPDAAGVARLQKALGPAIRTTVGPESLAFTFQCGAHEVRFSR